jgi:mono/diheme cytochrome c family protein
VATAKRKSPYFSATLERLPNVAAFFVAASGPHPLAQAPGGERYLQDGDVIVARGQQVFAENCAACHVSANKMPPPPPGIERYTDAWKDWTRSDAGARSEFLGR